MIRNEKLLTISTLVLLTLLMSAAPVRAQVSFAPAQNHPLKAVPFRALAGDLNGDGTPDIAALSIYGGTVTTLLNHGDGTFAPPRDFPALTPDPTGPTFFSGITLGDVDGDHNLDVILAHTIDVNTGTGIINVLLSNGDGTFQPPITTMVDSFAYRFIGVGDFNSDGRLDVACIADDPANTMQLVVLFLGNGDGTFVRKDSSRQAPSGDPTLADVNHDGKLDMVVPTKDFVETFLGNGDGTFQVPIQSPIPAPAFSLSVGDFDHDGKPDLVTSSNQ
jgi:FG-GAP-like repeat